MIEHTGTRVKKASNPLLRKRIIAIAIFVIAAAVVTTAGVLIGKPLLEMLGDPQAFQAWVDQQGAFGRIAFVGLVMMQVIIAWLPGEPLEIGAGYAFGFWEGSLLCMIGIVLGSVFVFLMVRRFGRQFISLFFPIEKIDNLPIFKDPKRLTLLSAIIFMIPGTPKDVLTYGIGLTPMKLTTWVLIAGVARIPPVITSTLSGSALGEQQYALAIIVFAATMLLSIAGLILYRKMTKKSKGEAA